MVAGPRVPTPALYGIPVPVVTEGTPPPRAGTSARVPAVSVAVVLPLSTVHVGTFSVTQIAELGVMVMVSDTPPAPAAPVLRAPLVEGVKTNLCLIGAMPSVNWFNDVAEPHSIGGGGVVT